MKKTFILFLSLIMLLTLSCEEDNDAIVLSHKLNLEAERTSEYHVAFSWNNPRLDNKLDYILVQTNEEKDFSFYKEIVDYYINYNYDDYSWPNWMYECELNYISSEKTTYEKYIWSDSHYYYKLIAYNSDGDYVFSNTLMY